MFSRPRCMARNWPLTEHELSEPLVTFREYSQHPPAAPALVQRDSRVLLSSCVLASKVRSIVTSAKKAVFSRRTEPAYT